MVPIEPANAETLRAIKSTAERWKLFMNGRVTPEIAHFKGVLVGKVPFN